LSPIVGFSPPSPTSLSFDPFSSSLSSPPFFSGVAPLSISSKASPSVAFSVSVLSMALSTSSVDFSLFELLLSPSLSSILSLRLVSSFDVLTVSSTNLIVIAGADFPSFSSETPPSSVFFAGVLQAARSIFSGVRPVLSILSPTFFSLSTSSSHVSIGSSL